MNLQQVIEKAKREITQDCTLSEFVLHFYDITDHRCVCHLGNEFPEHKPHQFLEEVLGNIEMLSFEMIPTDTYPENGGRVLHYQTIDLIRGIYEHDYDTYHIFPQKDEFLVGTISHLCSFVQRVLSGEYTQKEKKHILATGSLISFETCTTEYISFPGFDIQEGIFKTYPLGLGSLAGYPAHEYGYIALKI